MATAILPVQQRSVARGVCLGLAGVGGLTFGVGVILDPQRTWANVLIVSFIGVGLALAGVLLPALLRVTGAAWAGPTQRPLRAMTAVLPLAGVGLLLVLTIRPDLYPWTDTDPSEHHHGSAWQQVWLQYPFFLARAIAYLACWFAFAFFMRKAPRSQLLSGLFLVVFALTWWLASCDWIMSLEPAWASTMFGLYNFAGLFLSGLATVTLLVVWPQSQPAAVQANQLHDLGKLLFAFSTFWVYIWFCQYMLIWFVNIPEETSYYVRRLAGAWQPLFVVNVLLNWVVPFFVLLPRKSKRDPGILRRVCVVILLGRCLDVYLMVMPAVQDVATAPGLIDIGVLSGGLGCFGLAILAAMASSPDLSKMDALDPR